MSSHSDIDTLIAVLHPHVSMSMFNHRLFPPKSLRPSKDAADSRDLAQAFATLFSFHPGCDTAAVTARTPSAGNTSLSICLSPSTPCGFENDVKEWLTPFMTLCRKSKSAGDEQQNGTFSPLEISFIIYAYKICFPAMHQQTVDHGFGDWDVFVEEADAGAQDPGLKLTEEDEELAKRYAGKLRTFSELVRTFAARVSDPALGNDEDVLQFHELCMTIRDEMSDEGFTVYLNRYIYYGGIGPRLTYFNIPLSISTLLTLSRNSQISVDDQEGWIILDQNKEARRFDAVVTEAFLSERFGQLVRSVPERHINWRTVVRAFQRFTRIPGRYGSMGYDWDADANRLSTTEPATLHPEITLIQHLLENGEGRRGEAYIACSRIPCYASSVYAKAVNESHGTRFTMHVDEPEWCQLYDAEPWILPENTTPDVIEKMKEQFLMDLSWFIYSWAEIWPETYIPRVGDENLGWY